MRRVPDSVAVADEKLPLGSVALVRTAGVPAAVWAAAGSPQLFDRAAALDAEAARQAGWARELAERLGCDVVPDDRLPRADRGSVLALRRRLHAAGAPARGERTVTGAVARLAPALARELGELAEAAARLGAGREEFAREVAAERERAGRFLLHACTADPVPGGFVDQTSPHLLEDMARRAAAGEPWGGKRMRKSTGYLWRALARAAAKTTPRGWVGQLAAVPVDLNPAAVPAPPGAVPAQPTADGRQHPCVQRLLPCPAPRLTDTATLRTENVHALWSALRALDPPGEGSRLPLSLTPLHHLTGVPGSGTLRCCVVDPGPEGSRLRRLTLRRTAVLDTIVAVLADGPLGADRIEAAVAARSVPAPSPAALRGFLAHLLRLGVLQVCAAPQATRPEWTAPRPVPPPTGRGAREPSAVPRPRATGVRAAPRTAVAPGGFAAGGRSRTDGWFLDSYRALHTAVPGAAVPRVAEGLRLARRLAALRAADRGPQRPRWQQLDEAASIGPAPRSVAAILDAHHPVGTAAAPPRTPPRYTGWHPARTPGSGYARLLAHLAARLGEERVDVDEALLDAVGAPEVPAVLESWPADCLLRPLPGPGPLAVLESSSPAGVVDARFADALHALHGDYPNVRAYRAFLAALEQASGVRFLELLLPPLGESAANAVRRPVLTGWCTGDPDTALYHDRVPSGPGAPRPVRHIPLERITLRRLGDRLVAEVDGVRVHPVHHATRTAAPPYDRLLPLLLGAGHPATGDVVQLCGQAGAFPRAQRVPRLTVGGHLVVSPAQWRVPRTALWRATDTEPAKATALAALRRSLGLPRFVHLRATPGGKPVPVDLAALPALQAIERLCQTSDGAELIAEEALPAPGQLMLRDARYTGPPGDGDREAAGAADRPDAVAAQLMLRMPCDVPAAELAARAHAALRGTAGLPGAPGVPGWTSPTQ